ncbi:MAG TPA: PBP1A family penicillin-binding protein [Burkholderiaceae bacterium]
MSSASKRKWRRLALIWGGGALGAAFALILLMVAYVYVFVVPNLPTLESITDYQPKIPLRIYTADHALIGEFGEEHRNFVPIKDMPDVMKKAVLAAEDARFYEHGALDMKGITRALAVDVATLSFRQGGGTITMQVGREFFLSRRKYLFRKVTEIVLAYRIESALSKDQILELYMNQMYLGEHAYGFGSAAQIYFGKPINEITLAEAAMLAGTLKGPSSNNPYVNPARARQRQQYVLDHMHELGWINDAQYKAAQHEPLHLNSSAQPFSTHAEFAAELARQQIVKQFPDDAYTHGYVVTTTLKKADQDAAYDAVRRNVIEYDHRHGYRGPEGYVELAGDPDERDDAIAEALLKHPASDNLLPAVVLDADTKLVRVEQIGGETLEISGEGLRFAAPGLAAKAPAQKKIKRGSIIRISKDDKGKWEVNQLPEVAAAFVAIDSDTGAYQALVGGFDFNLNKFDHVSQAWRQPGSSFKPFVYSAALEKGFWPGTQINDVPLSVTPAESGGGPLWEPKNDDGFDNAPISMRYALAKSKNVPSVRILKAITPQYAQPYVARFGFDAAKIPTNLTMVLGTGSVTPLEEAGAYAVFANGGFQIQPYMVDKIADTKGRTFFEAKPTHAGQESERVIDARNAFIMNSMLQQVVRSGTGAMASKLGRSDIAGKTGTTSDALDGWFSGYGGKLVAVSWMGYDEPKSLGSREFGATLALPAWIDYMRVALKGVPDVQRPVPGGVVQNNGDWIYAEFAESGGVATLGMEDAQATQDQQQLAPEPVAAPIQGATLPANQPTPEEQERQRAIDMFKSGDNK